MELLTNPWVIIIIVLSVIIGNIMALKYTAKMKLGQRDKNRSSNMDKADSEHSDVVDSESSDSKEAHSDEMDKKDPQK